MKIQINFINNEEKKEQIKSLYAAKKFLFIYNGIINKNFNFNHNINNF